MQQDNNHPTQLFKQVLASTENLTQAHTDHLQTLLYSFPQCGVLHAIQARTANAEHITQAAAWFGTSELLEKVVKSPQHLPVITASQIIIRQRPKLKPISQVEAISAEPVVEMRPEIVSETDLTEPELQPIDVKEAFNKPEPEIVSVEESKEVPFAPPIFKQEPLQETQKLIIENLAANDYFVFDKAFNDRNHIEPQVAKSEPVTEEKPHFNIAQPVEEGSVTRYHDDKMPYSFLWWLDKTRSKHSQVYQPFANPAMQGKPIQPEPENHIKDVLDDRSKEEEIVERFIHDEPQMRPPSGDKLDNENKAKNSVEDQEELITETLARIYADQMLYSKAIAAYKILILKNPEKRRYFASQIEILQKKIN